MHATAKQPNREKYVQAATRDLSVSFKNQNPIMSEEPHDEAPLEDPEMISFSDFLASSWLPKTSMVKTALTGGFRPCYSPM